MLKISYAEKIVTIDDKTAEFYLLRLSELAWTLDCMASLDDWQYQGISLNKLWDGTNKAVFGAYNMLRKMGYKELADYINKKPMNIMRGDERCHTEGIEYQELERVA